MTTFGQLALLSANARAETAVSAAMPACVREVDHQVGHWRAALRGYVWAADPRSNRAFATDSEDAIASLGRGGSDLAAVLLATGLQACRCELIKDVPGYFTTDPHRDTSARHLPRLSFKEALQFADSGCDLVQRKAIDAAQRSRLPLIVRSLNENEPVSRIVETEQDKNWTDEIPSAVEAI